MANPWFRSLRRIPLSFLRNLSSSDPLTSRLIPIKPNPIPTHTTPSLLSQKWVLTRNFSHGSVHLVMSKGKPKFETRKTEPLTKEKWKTKKRFKQQRKRDKDKRKSVNKRDPRFIGVKGKKKKQKFATTSWPITLIIPSTRRRRSTTSAASSRDVLRHSLAKFPIHVYGSVWHRFPF